MFNNEVILTIAQAILANTKVIQSLVDHLPAEVREKVASVVVPVAAVAPVIPTPAPVVVALVVEPAPVVIPVVESKPVVQAPVMPAPPTFAAPVVASVVPGTAPFSDPKGLIDFVMSSYKALGAVKGAGIQGVLTGLGYQNINDVNPAHYGALFIGIEALKA
jgi:hypothetical protein